MKTERKGTQRSVLLVEEGGPMWANIRKALLKDGFALRSVEGRRDALQEIGRQEFEIIITGLKLQDSTELQVLRDLKQSAPLSEVIVLTDSPSQESKWEALKIGAYDYLSTPLEEYQIRDVARKALMHRNLRVNFRESGGSASEGTPGLVIPAPDEMPSSANGPGVTPSSAPFTLDKEEEKFSFWWKEDEDEEAGAKPPRPPSPHEPERPAPAGAERTDSIMATPPEPPAGLQGQPETPLIESSPQEPPPAGTLAGFEASEVENPVEPAPSPLASAESNREWIELKQEVEDLRLELSKHRQKNRELEMTLKVKEGLEAEIEALKSRVQDMEAAAPEAGLEPVAGIGSEKKKAKTVSLRLFAYTTTLLLISLIGLTYFGLVSLQRERQNVKVQGQLDQLQMQLASVQITFDRFLEQLPLPAVEQPTPPGEEAAAVPAVTEAKPAQPSWSDLPSVSPLGLPEGLLVISTTTRLRAGAGIEHKMVTEIGPGSLVKLLGREGEWSKVATEDDHEGFVWTPNTQAKVLDAAVIPGEKPKKLEQGGFVYPTLPVAVKLLRSHLSSPLRFRAVFMKGRETWEEIDLSPPPKPLSPFVAHRFDVFCPRGLSQDELKQDFSVKILAAPEKGDFEPLGEFPLPLR